jgi:plasmid stabilization system protein ParE
MSYRVVLQRLAVEDLREAYEWAARAAPRSAARWLERFQIALQSLDERPDRCPFAPENRKVDAELREYLFGRRPHVFRAIFLVDGDAVRILRIRRAQRRLLSRDELDAALDDES